MFGPPAANGQSFPFVPPQVAAAQDYLRFAEGLRNPAPMFEMHRVEARDLNNREQAVYDAALEVLRAYFMGEMDYAPTESGSRPSGDEPKDKVPVNA